MSKENLDLLFTPYEGLFEYVAATSHGEGYEYRVAYGSEQLPESTRAVFAVHLVGPPLFSSRTGMPTPHGKTMGKQVVAYPTWKELEGVYQAMQRIKALAVTSGFEIGE